MRSNERFLTFVEDLQSHASLWGVHCAEYKNCRKKKKRGDVINLIAKNMNSLLLKLKKKLPPSKVSSGESTKKLQHPGRVDLHQRNQLGLHMTPYCFCCGITSQEEVAVHSVKKKITFLH
jgi:hypothetical protein